MKQSFLLVVALTFASLAEGAEKKSLEEFAGFRLGMTLAEVLPLLVAKGFPELITMDGTLHDLANEKSKNLSVEEVKAYYEKIEGDPKRVSYPCTFSPNPDDMPVDRNSGQKLVCSVKEGSENGPIDTLVLRFYKQKVYQSVYLFSDKHAKASSQGVLGKFGDPEATPLYSVAALSGEGFASQKKCKVVNCQVKAWEAKRGKNTYYATVLYSGSSLLGGEAHVLMLVDGNATGAFMAEVKAFLNKAAKSKSKELGF